MDVYEKLGHPLALAVFVFTLLLPVLVGFLTLRRTRSQSDFFVGGRGMNPFVVALPVYGLIRVGGVAPMREMVVGTLPGAMDPFSLGLGALVGFVGIGLGSPGQPHILVRYMSVDNPRNLRTVAVVGTAWNVVLGTGAVAIGLLGRALIPQAQGLPNADPEMVYLALSSEIFGPLLFGLLVGGVFAALLSTADSQFLVVASTFARDVYEKVARSGSEPDEATRLRLGRVVVVVSGVAALVLAWVAHDLVFWLVLFAWGGLGASLGPALILSLFWRDATRNGIAAGMITGTLVTVVWKLWLREPTGLYELVPAFALATAAIVLVSLAGRKGPRPAD